MACVILPALGAFNQRPAAIGRPQHCGILPNVLPIKFVQHLCPIDAIGIALAIDQFIIILSKGIRKYVYMLSNQIVLTHHFSGYGQIFALLEIHVLQFRHATPIVVRRVGHKKLIEGTEATRYASRQTNTKYQ